MKKFILGLMTACLSLAFCPANLHASAAVSGPAKTEAPLDSVRTKTLLDKINAIGSAEQREQIKNKLGHKSHNAKTSNDGTREIGGGVYISVGALIIIIILLIILF